MAATNAVPTRRRPHALVVPLPSRGHLLPLLDFAHRLSTRHSVPLTVAVTSSNLPLISAFLASTPLAAALPLELPDAEHSSHLPRENTTRTSPSTSPVSASRSSPGRGLTQIPPRSSSPTSSSDGRSTSPTTSVSRGSCSTPAARSPSPRSSTSGRAHCRWIPTAHQSSFLTLSPAFPYEHVPSVVKEYVAGDPGWEFVLEGFRINARAWEAAVNTFDTMEREFLECLKRFFGHSRVWAVGPVADSICRREERSPEAERLFSWIDTCPAHSVVYVCFGSMYKPPPAQSAALGAALEASGQRFVWAVGADIAVLPEGLEERTAQRGRVVRGWAPQMEILRHAAVGAFLTYCGWNSTLEGVAAGVMLLAWPMMADQFIDARLVVDLHGAAEGAAAVPDPETLARVFADAVDGTKWADVRAKASALAAAAAEASEEGGSSWVALESMAKELETACMSPSFG